MSLLVSTTCEMISHKRFCSYIILIVMPVSGNIEVEETGGDSCRFGEKTGHRQVWRRIQQNSRSLYPYNAQIHYLAVFFLRISLRERKACHATGCVRCLLFNTSFNHPTAMSWSFKYIYRPKTLLNITFSMKTSTCDIERARITYTCMRLYSSV